MFQGRFKGTSSQRGKIDKRILQIFIGHKYSRIKKRDRESSIVLPHTQKHPQTQNLLLRMFKSLGRKSIFGEVGDPLLVAVEPPQ